jgi:hypothetical protein
MLIQMENTTNKTFESNQYVLVWFKFIVPPQGPRFVVQLWQLPMLNQMVFMFTTWRSISYRKGFMAATYSKVSWKGTTLEANQILTSVLSFWGFSQFPYTLIPILAYPYLTSLSICNGFFQVTLGIYYSFPSSQHQS